MNTELAGIGLLEDLLTAADRLVATAAPGEEVEVRHPLAARLVEAIAGRFPNTVPLADLVGDALAQCNPSDPGLAGANAEAFEVAVQELFSLFARGHLRAAPEPRRVDARIPDRPRACKLARLQAARGDAQMSPGTGTDLPLSVVRINRFKKGGVPFIVLGIINGI